MADVFDTKKRSEVMSRIRGKGNKSTELALVAALKKAGIKGWRRHIVLKLELRPKRGAPADAKPPFLIAKPDFVFRTERVAVFVDGCFWHQCPLHSKVPANNRGFWEHKLARNVERDRAANKALKAKGWRVVRIWEHDAADADRLARCVSRLCRAYALGPSATTAFSASRNRTASSAARYGLSSVKVAVRLPCG